PEQVQAAFADAVKAGQDRERQKNEGQAYANDIIPKARGMAARLQPRLEVPLLCSLDCLLSAALAAARLGAAKAARGSFAPPPPTPSTGLSPGLAAMLEEGSPR
ncbi:MAG: hypothetical protein ACO3EK_10200, partial [Alphaproteobacteria bacterium]